jgi:hypothetical protein
MELYNAYLQRVKEEIDRIQILYVEAAKLGQKERMKELRDELYEIGFTQCRINSGIVQAVEKLAKGQEIPKVAKILTKIRNRFDTIAQVQAKCLDDLLQVSLISGQNS